MTNFEYLMELNKLSGRTFNDLKQYPFFPYILADYTSPTLNLDDPLTFRQAATVYEAHKCMWCHVTFHLLRVQEI